MPTESIHDVPERLVNIEGRLLLLETLLRDFKRTADHEKAVSPWRHLVSRQHPWRKQLYIKGRNLTARQLVGSIKANKWDENQGAENYHLPVEAIREALAYVELNLDLLTIETEIERLMGKREEAPRVPQPVS